MSRTDSLAFSGPRPRVLITGATGGIGTEICRALHRDGAQLAVHYSRNREHAEEIAARNGGSRAIHADLMTADGPDRLWDAAVDALGGVDVLVNNAGLWLRSPLDDDAGWQTGWNDNLALNLRQAAWLTRRAVLAFCARDDPQGGAIISVTSRSAIRGDDIDHLAYGVAKAGLQNLMKGVARAYAHRGVLAYSVAPAMVDTGMVSGHLTAHDVADLPLGELVPPVEVAETVAFLASGRARHLTGSTLDITGADYVR